ncbi:MAG: hypothetical protein ACYDBQ_04040 [Thermoplasmatota archaeon]
MQKMRLLQQFKAQSDVDYVDCFQGLAALSLEIRRSGPTPERLLRKATLEMDIGNHVAALAAARHAGQLASRAGEPHFVAARALVLMALVRARALAGAPGLDEGSETPSQLVRDAVGELHHALRLNPEDEEAREDVVVLEALLAAHPVDQQLDITLRQSDR